jgi:hypothetical protein
MIHHGIGRSFALRYRFRGQDEVNARQKSYRIVKAEESDRRIRPLRQHYESDKFRLRGKASSEDFSSLCRTGHSLLSSYEDRA